MRAIDLLLSSYPEWSKHFTFVQVGAPTRSKLLAYRMLQDEAEALARDINERHGFGDYQPIRLIIRHHDAGQIFELFRAADVSIPTPSFASAERPKRFRTTERQTSTGA